MLKLHGLKPEEAKQAVLDYAINFEAYCDFKKIAWNTADNTLSAWKTFIWGLELAYDKKVFMDYKARGTFTADECKMPRLIIKKLKQLYKVSDENMWDERKILLKMRQGKDEALITFTTRLEQQASKCGYGEPEELHTHLAEMLYLGTESITLATWIEEKLREEEQVTYEKMKEELSKIEAKNDRVKKELKEGKSLTCIERASLEGKSVEDSVSIDAISFQSRGRNANRNTCRRCGGDHRYGKCPAYGKTCDKCGERNHWAKMCKRDGQRDGQEDRKDRSNSRGRRSSSRSKDSYKNSIDIKQQIREAIREEMQEMMEKSKKAQKKAIEQDTIEINLPDDEEDQFVRPRFGLSFNNFG